MNIIKHFLNGHVVDRNNITKIEHYLHRDSIMPVNIFYIGECLECKKEIKITPFVRFNQK